MKRHRLLFLLLCMGIALFLNTTDVHAYYLTISPPDGGSVTSFPPGIDDCTYFNNYYCSYDFSNNTYVLLIASAFSGYGFVDWSGDCAGTERVINVYMNGAKTCDANFESCNITFTPEERTVPETAGEYTVAISTTPLNCPWTLSSDEWITITSGTEGSGAGLVHYTVEPNSGRVRLGYITTDTETSFPIMQEGAGSGYVPYGGHYYKRYDMLLNWQDAETFCEGRGGYLATITDINEQTAVSNLVSGGTYVFHQCWIGGFQPPGSTSEPGGDWQWLTGETWTWVAYDLPWCSSPYSAPYDPLGTQDSLAMAYDCDPGYGSWIDANGILLKSFICEWTNLQYLLSVSKTGTGYGTVRSSESVPHIDCCSGACEPVCSALYSPGTPVILNALPDASSTFIGWSGACTGAGQCNVSMNNDTDVTAVFNLRQYTVSTHTNEGGSISPQSAVVTHGDSTEFDITVNQDFHIASASGCGGALEGDTYYTGPITGNCTVTVNFAPYTHTVSTAVIPQAGGSISPTSAVVNHNATTQFTVTASPGFHLVSATGCGGSLSGAQYTTGQITSDCTISATFAIDTYTVSASAGAGGNISPSGAATVNYGGTPAFTVTPDHGYHITGVTGTCGGSLNGNTYTTNPVSGNCTIQASFSVNEYTVSTSAGQGGGIAPASVQVAHGNTAQFTITPDAGYHIVSVSGCAETLAQSSLKAAAKKKKKGLARALNSSTYTTGPVTGDCTVSATFEVNTYTVTAEAGEGGSINPSNSAVNHGDTAQFTVTPDPGYHIKAVTGCGGSLNGNIYTTGQITENCTVSSSFEATYTVTILKSGNGNGAIVAQGLACEGNACSAEYMDGTKVMVKVQPDAGFRVADVRIDGVSIGAMNTFTFKNLTGNHMVEIIFAPL